MPTEPSHTRNANRSACRLDCCTLVSPARYFRCTPWQGDARQDDGRRARRHQVELWSGSTTGGRARITNAQTTTITPSAQEGFLTRHDVRACSKNRYASDQSVQHTCSGHRVPQPKTKRRQNCPELANERRTNEEHTRTFCACMA